MVRIGKFAATPSPVSGGGLRVPVSGLIRAPRDRLIRLAAPRRSPPACGARGCAWVGENGEVHAAQFGPMMMWAEGGELRWDEAAQQSGDSEAGGALAATKPLTSRQMQALR